MLIKEQEQKDFLSHRDLYKILFIGVLSFIAVFGIYNTFSDINLISMIGKITNQNEKYANYFILSLTIVTMVTLQGINFKKKALMAKAGVIISIFIIIAIILGTIFYFTTSLLYPVISLIIVGLTTFLLDMVFDTMGTKGFFFFLLLMSLGILGIYKAGFHSTGLIMTLSETVLALIIFIGATYPRLKSSLFKIGVRDNVDISNTGSDDFDNSDDGDN